MLKLTIRTAVLSVLTASLLFGLTSCKKSDPKSRTELITQSGWKIVKSESKTGTGPWVDNTSGYAPCDKDNVLGFSTNGNFEFNEGATKCSPLDPQIIQSGTWVFTNGETKISVTSGGFTDMADIDQLDEGTLVISSSDLSGTPAYYNRDTYGH